MSPAYDKRQLLKSAYNYAQAGSWDKALDEYRRASKLFTDDPNIYSMIADLLLKKGDGAGAAASHLEAGRLHREQGNDDKELGALRKALKVQAGNAEAAARMESHFERVIAKATTLLSQAKYTQAEEIAQKLLDVDPGNLQVNRLLDDLRARHMQEEAVKAFQEEERLAAAQAPVADATREVMERLRGTAEKYLGTEDFDNAIETLMIMIKIDPGKVEIREQLERAQEQLKKKQEAQTVWQNIMVRDQERAGQARDAEVTAKEQADWENQEQALRDRLARELQAAEEVAKTELDIIEKAMREIRGSASGAASASAADQSRLRDLEMEKNQVQEILTREKEDVIERERHVQEQARTDAEKLRHAMELEKVEQEAKSRDEGLKELKDRMEAERKAYEAKLEAERRRSAETEAALKNQLSELMREEMSKLKSELKQQAMEELTNKMESERLLREKTERELTAREDEVEKRLREEQRRMESERNAAEGQARKERDAIEKLKAEEEARRQRLLDEAVQRRSMRSGGGSADQKQAVLKASRRISDALHAAATKHLESDLDKMMDTARRYLDQNLLLDAMRICQKITALDPANEKVKELLKEIYVKKGL